MNVKPIPQDGRHFSKGETEMNNALRTAALSLALPGVMAASLPAAAATWQPASTDHVEVYNKHGYDRYREYDRRSYGQRTYQQPYYNDGYQTWRGNDGRYYCRKKDGTTGLIIGGAAGALLGRSIAGRGDNTLGTILGAAGGALLGRSVDRNSSSRCR
jgi:hypothetical protein